MEEHIAKPLNKCKVTFVGDVRNNMAYAWAYGCAKMGMSFVAYGPQELIDNVDSNVIKACHEISSQSGASIKFSNNIEDIKGSDVIYSDIWASMGEEDLIPERAKLLSPYRIDNNFMEKVHNLDVLFSIAYLLSTISKLLLLKNGKKKVWIFEKSQMKYLKVHALLCLMKRKIVCTQ